MKLLRKINNNAAVAQDNRGREMVVLGRGVGFHPMPYELTDLSVVYRTFYDVDPQYYEILSNLPEDALLAAADITEQAEITLHTELNPNLPFTLADHIAFAQQREKQGIRMAAPLHYDVQHLYPREYELGLRALETVRLRTSSSLPRAEAVSIALHIVNAELEGSDLSSTLTAVEVLDEVTTSVEQVCHAHPVSGAAALRRGSYGTGQRKNAGRAFPRISRRLPLCLHRGAEY